MEGGGGGMRRNFYRSGFSTSGIIINAAAAVVAAADDGIELSLGLSTNGRFGFDPQTTTLRRSSSVSDLLPNSVSYDSGVGYPAPGSAAPLARASSVPTETDDSRQKEDQARRSMEARRQRMDKLKSVRGLRSVGSPPDVNGLLQGDCEGTSALAETEKTNGRSENWIPGTSPSQGSLGASSNATAAGANSDVHKDQPLEGTNQHSSNTSSTVQTIPAVQVISFGAPAVLPPAGFGAPVLLPPAGFGAPAVQTPSRSGAPAVHSVGNGVPALPALQIASNTLPVVEVASNAANEGDRKVLHNMPYVSTRGYGPNHNRIEGFLYRYRTRDDLKIVCVCHGLFLSPAEFVKHGGGGEVDVAQPLKHIVVTPFPFP